MGTSPNLCYIPGPDPPTNSAGGNREEQQDRTSNIIQFELGWNPHGSKGFSRLALRIGNLISSAASHWQIGAGGGQNGPVCPRFFAAVGRISDEMQKKSSMVRIVLQRPFCSNFTHIFGKMQDVMQDKREPAKPHGNWAAADMPAGRSRKMRDLDPFFRTN